METPEKRSSLARGRLFVVSAPSGAGKTTLCQALRKKFPDLAYSISYTTRAPRTGEVDGREYHFVSQKDFKDGIQNGKWAEWAEVYGNYYGTSARFLEETLSMGKDLLLEIDIRGKTQIAALFPDCIGIFILPPSVSELERRLGARGNNTPDDLKRRLASAMEEMSHKKDYRYRIVNDDLEEAKRALFAVVEGCKGGQCPEKTDFP